MNNNIPTGYQCQIDEIMSEQPIYCTECQKEVTDNYEIEIEAHLDCIEKIKETLNQIK